MGQLPQSAFGDTERDGGRSSSEITEATDSTSEMNTSSEVTPSDSTGSAAPDDTSTGPGDENTKDPDACLSASDLPEPAVRYDFAGSGTDVIDVMGGPSGTLRGGATLTDAGSVTLDGDDDYVDLPNGLLSAHVSATLLVWASVSDGPAYWRLLDFGNSSEGEDPTGSSVGTTYVAITTETGLEPSGLALLVGHGGASAEDRALTALKLESPLTALGVVLDGATNTASLYVDGALVASSALTEPLSALEDVNNWLGRSQYAADPHYPGTYSELRVYAEALDDCAVQRLTELGPDVLR